MNTRCKSLFVVLAILGVFLTLQLNNALAQEPWVNPMQGPEWCPSCVPVHHTQMGEFVNGVWQFNWPTHAPDGLPLPDICEDWGPANPCADLELWTPTLGMNINEARLQNRIHADEPAFTTVALNAGVTIQYPEVWMMPPGAEHNDEWSWMAGFMPPDGTDWDNPYLQDPNGCITDFSQYAECLPGQNDCEQQPEFCFFDNVGDNSAADITGYTGTYMWYPGTGWDDPNVPDGTAMCPSAFMPNAWCGAGWTDAGPGNDPAPFQDYARMMPCNTLDICQDVNVPADPTVPGTCWWNNFNPLMNADDDVDPGCKEQRRVNMLTDVLEPLTSDRIVSMAWIGPDQLTTYMIYHDSLTVGNYEYINYNSGARMWESAEFNSYGPEIRWTSTELLKVGDNIFTVIYDTDQVLTFTINVPDISPMPIVPAVITQIQYVEDKAKANKSGKAVKMLETEVSIKNITTRFLDNGALVVQWPEPDGALMGGMQLRLYIGNDIANPNGSDDEEFLWIDAPSQIGTIVIPADIWEPFVVRSLEGTPGATEVYARFMYRKIYDTNGDWRFGYHNRGYSGLFFIPFN